MASRCSGITRSGTRCQRSAEGPHGLCWLHDPTRSEERRRAASRAGKSKPNREIIEIKQRLSELADAVLDEQVEKGVGAVAAQILNTYLSAMRVELKVKEVEEIEARLEVVEERLAARQEERKRWGG